MIESFKRRRPLRHHPRRQQPHRRLHAGHRPRCLHHQAARHVRLTLLPPSAPLHDHPCVRQEEEHFRLKCSLQRGSLPTSSMRAPTPQQKDIETNRTQGESTQPTGKEQTDGFAEHAPGPFVKHRIEDEAGPPQREEHQNRGKPHLQAPREQRSHRSDEERVAVSGHQTGHQCQPPTANPGSNVRRSSPSRRQESSHAPSIAIMPRSARDDHVALPPGVSRREKHVHLPRRPPYSRNTSLA